MTARMTDRVLIACGVDECDRTRRGQQAYCEKHLQRLRKYGTVDDPPMVRSMRLQRETLARVCTEEALEEGACWEWPAVRQRDRGYGLVAPSLTVVRSQLAHRNAYALAFRGLPDDLEVCHRCDNPPCFRPSHLFVGSHADNMADMARKGRQTVKSGSQSPRARFTTETAAHVVALHESGLTYTEIGRRFGVHLSTISRLVIGQTSYLTEVPEWATQANAS